jgi:hypothetical protein
VEEIVTAAALAATEDRGPTPLTIGAGKFAPTNATPDTLARLDECPHRGPQLQSAARHCHLSDRLPELYVEAGTIRVTKHDFPLPLSDVLLDLVEKNLDSPTASLASALVGWVQSESAKVAT